jgi:hypothetical protein
MEFKSNSFASSTPTASPALIREKERIFRNMLFAFIRKIADGEFVELTDMKPGFSGQRNSTTYTRHYDVVKDGKIKTLTIIGFRKDEDADNISSIEIADELVDCFKKYLEESTGWKTIEQNALV